MSAQAKKHGSQDQQEDTSSQQPTDPQLQKLQRWTEKPFPIELREDSKTPVLHQFTNAQLREGLIYAVTANKALAKELEPLVEIYERQYAGAEYKQTFKSVMKRILQELVIEYDDEVMLEQDLLDEEDHAKAIREWKGGLGYSWYEEERSLRYTLCVISRKNDKMRANIPGFRKSIAKAQGDV